MGGTDRCHRVTGGDCAAIRETRDAGASVGNLGSPSPGFPWAYERNLSLRLAEKNAECTYENRLLSAVLEHP